MEVPRRGMYAGGWVSPSNRFTNGATRYVRRQATACSSTVSRAWRPKAGKRGADEADARADEERNGSVKL